MKNPLLLLLFFPLISNAQITEGKLLNKALAKFEFIQETIITESDTIVYYLTDYKRRTPTKLVVFIQGTSANPLFSYEMKNGKPVFYRWFNDDFQHIDDSTVFAIIPKPGMHGLFHDDEIQVPTKYYVSNYKDYRVNQIHQSIEHIVENHMESSDKVIVYGHSEGAAIASGLALKNDKITHLGFWSGNVLNNFYEFSLFNRIESLKGSMSDSLAHENVMGIINWYSNVIEDPESVDLDQIGFTNKRWSSYERPPIEELLDIEIPIFALFASEDESTPIETAYLLPIQFMEKRKPNLTFEVCIGCDHGYVQKSEKDETQHWSRLFRKFLEWTEQ